MANIGRNAPCPCGSGKKYKRCHLGLANDPGNAAEVQAQTAEAPLATRPGFAQWVPYGIGTVGAGLAFFAFQVGTQPGLATLAATALVIGGWFIFGNPPPPRADAGDPAGLNFGR